VCDNNYLIGDLMAWNDGLEINSPHYDIALSNGKYVSVRAGPGTGKTYAMMRKIARLIEVENVQPSQILAVSFTRTAASDLIDQLSKLDVNGAKEVHASTLHSLAFHILGKNNFFEMTNRNPRPLLDFEKKCLISDIWHNSGGIREGEKLLNAFESYWAKLQHQIPGSPNSEEEQEFQKLLTQWLIYHEGMLISELFPKTLDFLRTNPEIAKKYYYEHILVDEYQDLNKAEQEFIEIISKNGTLTVIGDENQSIYSFKHANPEGILDFSKTHEPTEKKELYECKRCPKIVLKFAENLIKNNRNVSKYPFYCPDSQFEGDVHIVQHYTLEEESENIANYVKWILNKDKTLTLNDFLVLAPSKIIGYKIRDTLNSLGIQSQSYYSEECLDSDPSKEGMCILRLLINPNDRVALRAWSGIGKPNYRTGSYIRLKKIAEDNELSPRETFEKILSGDLNFNTHGGDLIQRYQLLKGKIDSYNNETKEDLVNFFWSDGEECNQIREIAFSIIDDCNTNEDFLSNLIKVISQPELPKENEQIVRVMSLHKSKGLTAKIVIIAGCIQGLIPRVDKDITPEEKIRQLEEQRRLFYVGLTRTKQTLVLSCSTMLSPLKDVHKMRIPIIEEQFYNGKGGFAKVYSSSFLSEIQPDHKIKTITGYEWKSNLGF
jgi:superfamily I DNA/RNA helicase